MSPWGERVPIHVSWDLLWVAAIAGVLFLIVHAIYVGYWAKPAAESQSDSKLRRESLPAFPSVSPGIRLGPEPFIG